MHLFPITIQKEMKITMTTTNVKTKLQKIRKFKELWYERAYDQFTNSLKGPGSTEKDLGEVWIWK